MAVGREEMGAKPPQDATPPQGDNALLGLIEAVLDHVEQGLAVYGPDRILRFCNARYGALLSLPQGTLLPGKTHLLDVVRALAQRGDYGGGDPETHAREQYAALQERSVARDERRLPSGLWLRLSRAHLPDGGFVVTLTDITALKETEATLIASRDEARQARQQLAAAIESMSEGFVLWDAQDRLVMFNARYRDEYSFAPECLVPGVSFETVLRESVKRGLVPVGYDPELWVRERLHQHRNPAAPYIVERRDGRSVLITEYRTQEGGVVGIRTDVTQIKNSERAAREARQRLVEAIEAIPQGFIIFDPDDRIVSFNRHYKERYSLVPDIIRPGLSFEAMVREALRRDLIDVPQAHREAWIRKRVAEHRSGANKLTDERNGRWVTITESRTESGHIVVIHTDVTELKQRERELTRSRRLLRSVIDAVPAVINVKDRQSRYVLMNRFQGTVYGIDPAAAIGKTSADVVGPDYGGHSVEMDEGVVRSGAALPWSERDFIDPGGKPYTWLTTKIPLKDDLGRVENVLTVALDITALKATERARSNLARYVAPNMVDILARADEPFGPARSQEIAVLFADLVGFTQLAAQSAPELVFAMLRDLQNRLARAVFAWGGTLDKFTGDGLMATFGTPDPTGCDAANALSCARAIATDIAAFDAGRRAHGQPSLRASVGVHWGPALMGNIGDEKRLEFAVVGDTVNVASRLESLTRLLDAGVVASEAVIRRAADEGRPAEGFIARGPQVLKGRRAPVEVWTYCV